MEAKKVICASCDIGCSVTAEVEGGRVLRVRQSEVPAFEKNICMKGVHAPKGFAHEDRLMKPLRRKGARGGNEWETVEWESAMSDIGERLSRVIERYGPEAWAVSTSVWNTSTDYGMGRRLMNLVGSPNWISGVALCAGNTAAINRMVYGWFPFADYANTQTIVLFGHNPKKHSWTPIYNNIAAAQARGAKLIVLDPRRSESAERADLWLPLRAGTDAAMCLGWLKVILDEGLYDEDFVANHTHGFEAFRKRIDEFPLDRVAQITGVDAESIARAARIYATNGPAVIPWTPITDQQRNSTSAIRLHCSLRALCGHLDVPGGEVLMGFNPQVLTDTQLELHERQPQAQKDKQLGSDTHPAFTYRGTAALGEPTKRVWGHEYANIVTGSYMANPSAVFRAMAYGEPYPVKAFTFLGNNPLMSYANMPLIHDALMNQDLIVGHEQFLTPTAQIADYVLPADSWLERPALSDGFGWTSLVRPSQQAVEPPGECKSTFDFWRLLADALGQGEHFPWANLDEIHAHRLAATGLDFDAFSELPIFGAPPEFKKYEKTGFATPTGKVELESTILADLGFDALPYYREAPPGDPAFPLQMFTGVREDEFFQTGHRHIEPLRKRRPEPTLFVHSETASEYEIEQDEWVEVENKTGRIRIRVCVRDDMPPGLVRIPHGWWKPETERGLGKLSSAWEHADAQLCPDDEDYLDREQGIPHLKGIPCRINKLTPAGPGAGA